LDQLAVEVDCLQNSGIERSIEDAYENIIRVLPSSLPERAVWVFAADTDHFV